MSTNSKGRDYHLREGKWESTDVLGGCPEGEDVEKFLESQGWEEFLGVGNSDGWLHVKSWIRSPEEGGPTEYLLEVGDPAYCSPYMRVGSFPELMDLFARWAPAIQAEAIVQTIEEMGGASISAYGLVERVAAKVIHGPEKVSRESRVLEEQRRRARAMREQRDGQ